MSKAPAKPAAAAGAEAPKKSKKMLIIIIAAVLLIGGGAAAFFLMKPHDAKKEAAEETQKEVPPKYVELGTFTANLLHEEGDRYLQVAISLKLTKPELEEKVKASNPEILHRVNMLLQSKSPSELATLAGKEKLARDIKAQVEYVIGFRKTPPVTTPSEVHHAEPAATSGIVATSPQSAVVAAIAPVEAEHAAAAEKTEEAPQEETKVVPKTSGIAEVLFTSFIIQ
ncbi:MAG: flagellar basal body-associated FliL family protein [Gallionella sp.]